MDMDERTMHNLDYMAKINLWLMKRYGNELFKEFEVCEDDYMAIIKIFDKIYQEQCKEMPLPWYEYGFGSKE